MRLGKRNRGRRILCAEGGYSGDEGGVRGIDDGTDQSRTRVSHLRRHTDAMIGTARTIGTIEVAKSGLSKNIALKPVS